MKKFFANSLIMMAAAGAFLFLTGSGKAEPSPQKTDRKPVQEAAAPSQPAGKTLPRLLDLGAQKCIPCKKMAPILEELAREYVGRMKVEFIDVWQNSAAGQKYGIRSIPTQIFYGSDGKELFRHEGFMAKEDILAKWTELGYAFPETTEKEK